jgi:hypothetical protein
LVACDACGKLEHPSVAKNEEYTSANSATLRMIAEGLKKGQICPMRETQLE